MKEDYLLTIYYLATDLRYDIRIALENLKRYEGVCNACQALWHKTTGHH